jgi:hypothetical protein
MRRRRDPPDHRLSTRSTTSTGSPRSGTERTKLSGNTNADPCGAVCSIGVASGSDTGWCGVGGLLGVLFFDRSVAILMSIVASGILCLGVGMPIAGYSSLG